MSNQPREIYKRYEIILPTPGDYRIYWLAYPNDTENPYLYSSISVEHLKQMIDVVDKNAVIGEKKSVDWWNGILKEQGIIHG